MFKPTKANSVEEYIAALTPERKDIILTLHEMIQKISPKFKPHFAYNMLGYGTFKYLNYKKETVDWPLVALASQKNYISLYICALDVDQYIAEKYKSKLGKVSVGKSCIRFKKLTDLNMEGIKMVLIKAAKSPGLIKTA